MPYKTDIYGRLLEGTIWYAPWGKSQIEKVEQPMLYGRHKRFAITLVIRDAEGVSDQQVNDGLSPPIVWEGSAESLSLALAQALAWCDAEERNSYEPNPVDRLKGAQE